MAPGGKRKRSERSSVDSGENRPSPHRPQNTNMAQHDRGTEMRDGGRRPSRGGQGGTGGGRGRRNDARDNPNKLNITGTGRATPTPGPMSPPPPRPSSAAPTPAQTPTPTQEIPSPIFKPKITPFDYSFVTQARISAWERSGHEEVTSAGRQAVADEDPMDLGCIFQELIHAALDAHLDAGLAGKCVKEILRLDVAPTDDSASSFDAPTAFLDHLSIVLEADEDTNISLLRSFLIATAISPIILRQKLDSKVLQDTGLARETFSRMSIRQATNQLYRQANYNLLREETEGYSKLVTELFTTSGSEPPSSEAVEDAFERVKGLIGTFDLDVGRVLDITLDIFAAVLVKHYRFFIKFLRVSSWWPRTEEMEGERYGGLPDWALPSSTHWMLSDEDEEKCRKKRIDRDILFWDRAREVGLDAFFQLGGRQLLDEDTKKRLLAGKGSNDKDIDTDRQWIEQTGTLPPPGNRVAAQLLGFKLRFYASAARDDDDMLPHNLLYLTALLIKIGFISLRDLYPHLWPLDEDMPALQKKKAIELAEKEKLNRPGGGASNALTTHGALTDDTIPGGGRARETASSKSDPAAKPTAEAEEKEKANEPSEQKVLLLVQLLTIGAIPESLFMLGRFPWLPEAFPELIPLLNRILNHSIKDVYEQVRPSCTAATKEEVACPTKKVAEADQSGVPKGQVRLTQLPTRKMLRWPFPDKQDTNDNMAYRFYWDEWTDNIPVCRNVDDLFTLCNTLLNFSGVSIGKDATLLPKLVRIGNHSLRTDRSQHNFDRWQELLKRLIVPALSLTVANSNIANEIFSMLKLYPTPIRYSIYAEWFQGATTRQYAMKLAFARTKLETLSTMKRISKTNVAPMARALAKIAYSSPGIVFNIALNQIEVYSNLTEVVVECAKQFTHLGFDVLVWSLMSSLGSKGRDRNNAEFALLPGAWLLALSRFSGKVYKRYSHMNLSPILRYVTDQIYRGNSTDLVILKELIAQMTGIVPDIDFTDAQILAMTGGVELRKQTLINLQDKRFESTKTSHRLMKALVDSKVAGELLISIAHHRQAAIYKIPDSDAHIKLLATMIDDTQDALSQYLDLLRSNLSVEEFDQQVPGIPELLTDFGLQPALAFMIGRPSLAYLRSIAVSPLLNGTTKALPELVNSSAADSEGDIGMAEAALVNTNSDEQPVLVNGNVVREAEQMDDVKEESPPTISADPFHAVLEPIIATVQTALPEGSFKALTPEFYATFWSTTLGDLAIPNISYTIELDRLKAELGDIGRDRSDMSRTGVAAKEKKKKDISETRDKLLAELKESLNSFSQKKSRLLRYKSLWFPANIKGDAASEAFLEKCLLPRLLLSHSDAEYCFRMVKFLHDNGVPYFRTLSLYSQIFRPNRLRAMIFTCTVREAEHLGRFLRLVLTDLNRWYSDKTVFEKEAWGSQANLPGFAKALDENGKPKAFIDHVLGDDKSFKSILFRWHQSLNKALRDCFEGTEWMHIRNAITILKSVVEVFPVINFQGAKFLELLGGIATREKGSREDLALTGNAVLVQLKKRETTWMMVQAFGHTGSLGQGTIEAGKAGQANGKPAAKSSLKPTAPEFKPGSRASSLGVSTPKPNSIEVEDGEVDDARTSARNASATAKSSAITDRPWDSNRATPPAAAMESKKSEILDKRAQIKRDQAAAKASMSTPPHLALPSRSDLGRNSTPTSVLDRGSPNLPNRPDAPIPSRDLIDRHPRHGDRRDGRDPRSSDPRLDRPIGRPGERPGDRLGDILRDRPGDRPRDFPAGPGDLLRDRPGDRSRDFPSNNKRAVEPTSREFGRSSERPSVADRERIRPDPPPRWTADSAREKLERSTIAREAESGRLSREMPPPRPSGTSSDRGMPPTSTDRQEIINPERAALISGDKDTSRSNSPRRGREESKDRVPSRPQSPRRHGSDKERSDPRRDDRPPRSGPQDNYNSPRNRVEDVQSPPAGPRSDRPMERERGGPNDRSTFQPAQPPPRSVDLDHGRLNNTSRPQPDPNFGRLTQNPPPSDVPSGPRDRNIRGPRAPNPPPAPRSEGRSRDIPRAPTPEKQPPTGPSSGRHPRRSASGQFDSAPSISGPPATPTTPVTASPASAIHPDRLKQLGAPVTQPPLQPQPANQAPVAAIHPDRLRAFGTEEPVKSQSPSQSNSNRSRPNVPPVTTSGPPSGPRGAQSSPIHPGSNGFAAPTGPASATERAQRGGRRQLAGINTMLQQAGQQNTPDRVNVRGRGARISSGMGPETPISGPSTPALPVPPPPPPPGPPPRQEPTRDTGRDIINPARADLIIDPEAATEDRDRDRNGRRERSGRSRRSSRSPARERDSKRSAPEDERALRSEYRDRSDRRTGDRGEPEKDRHQVRSSPTPARGDLMAGRESAGGRESGRDRERGERERESNRRDGRERDATRDPNASGWAGERGERNNERGGGGRSSRDTRSEEQRRESRGSREEGSRKRRSDEGGLDSRGHTEKRPRR